MARKMASEFITERMEGNIKGDENRMNLMA